MAVCVSGCGVYPFGLEFNLITMGGPGSEELWIDPHEIMMLRHGHWRRQGGEIPPEMLRFGVELPDGRRATNVGSDPHGEIAAGGDEDDESFRPRDPVLTERGGGGGGLDWHQGMWLWPLPGPGTLTLACEWPALNIPLTKTQVDSAPILAAAERAQVIFEFPEPPEGTWGDGIQVIR